MTKQQVRHIIETVAILPAIRSAGADDARFGAEAVQAAGIPIIEITMTVPGAVDVIRGLARDYKDLVVGAGTVLDLEAARRCIDAGASYVTSPGFDPRIMEFVVSQNVLAMPGTVTPSEIIAARHVGADLIKVFPCAPSGGASYIKALKGPFPDVPLVAAGGVNQQTAMDFILAGAMAIGIGSELVPRRALRLRQADWIAELCRRFTSLVSSARNQLSTGEERRA